MTAEKKKKQQRTRIRMLMGLYWQINEKNAHTAQPVPTMNSEIS